MSAGDVRLRARRGVVFCTGGFSHNDTLRDQYLSGLLVPGCSVPTNQGVLVEVSKRLGAPLIHMNAASVEPAKVLVPGSTLLRFPQTSLICKHGSRRFPHRAITSLPLSEG